MTTDPSHWGDKLANIYLEIDIINIIQKRRLRRYTK